MDKCQTHQDPQACALRLLARREHSRLELRNKLLLRGFSPEAIEPVLDKLAAQGWQDDVRFANAYVHSCIERGDGILKIKANLRERGLTEAIILAVLPADDGFWQEQLLRKWGKKYVASTDLVVRAKQSRFLQSRGFTFNQIKILWKQHHEE